MRILTADELSNERYHSADFPQASGTVLAAIHADCPAGWRFSEPKESDPMNKGINAHIALLEPVVFANCYVRGLDVEEHGDALVTGKDLEGWCRDMGIKGCSGKQKAELINFIMERADNPPKIWDLMTAQHEVESAARGVSVIECKIYDLVKRMRDVIFINGHGELLEGGLQELSLIDDDANLKVRLDHLGSHDGRATIVDYKTTTSAHPEAFGAQAYRMNYWLKMALQFDLHVKAFGEEPRIILLAQSVKPPYIVQPYEMTSEQLDIGREHYQQAHRVFQECIKTNVWPAYGGQIQELQTPGWIARQYGFDIEAGITFLE